jgi:DNA polymerase-3 subunit epsilon
MSLLDLTLPTAVQRSFDDLGTALHDVTFVVLDLETTGGSPRDCRITEIGATKVRSGECLGTFQTLVNPGQAIPPEIVVLTGITEAMVVPAPRIETVLPSLLEFIGDAVIVGHNVRFDLGFLRAALERDDRPLLANRWVDTAALARRLVRDEVPNCRLGTLASRLRLDHQPSHRALDDALATADLLHLLLERAGRLGVTGLDDLLALPKIGGHDQAAKLRLTESLPRAPGVYLFRNSRGEVLYVGKATNLRTRVRSYFSSDQRRKIAQLLRETTRIDHEVLPTTLHAAVREVRLIHEHAPHYNRHAKSWEKYVYLKLTLAERFPRFAVVRSARDDGGFYLGPLASTAQARLVADAVESVIPLRRCAARPGAAPRAAPCAPAQLGVATCPCAGQIGEAAYADLVGRALDALTVRPEIVLDPLRARMEALAAEQRFEEATDVRNRAAALVAAITRQRRLDRLRRSGVVAVETPSGLRISLRCGRLTDDPLTGAPGSVQGEGLLPDPLLAGRHPLPKDLADELTCVARWLDDEAPQLRLVAADPGLWSTIPRLADFSPRTPPRRHKRGQ